MAEPPPLPETAPVELRDFVACGRASVTVRGGPLEWLPLPKELKDWGPTPTLGLEPGSTPGTGTLTIDLGLFKVELPVSIVDGELRIDASGVSAIPGAGDAIDTWTRQFNDWLRQNGQRLEPATIAGNAVTLTKAPIPAGPGSGTGATGPAPPVTPPGGSTPPPGGAGGATPSGPDATGDGSSGGRGGWCALLGLLLVGLFGLGALGVATGVIALPGAAPASDGVGPSTAPRPTDGQPEPTDGQPEPTDGQPDPTDGQPEPPSADVPPGAELAAELLRQIGFRWDPERARWVDDAGGDLYFPDPGTPVQLHPPEVDLRAMAAGSIDLTSDMAAALTDLAGCGEAGALDDGTAFTMACSQQRPMPAGPTAVVVTTWAGPFPDEVPPAALWSWSIFSDVDDDAATGYASQLADNYLIGADVFLELLAFQSSADGEFRSYILGTRPDDPPRTDTGQTQGNLVTDARAAWFPEPGVIAWFVPLGDLGPSVGAGAFTTTDRAANGPDTLAADALGDPADTGFPSRWELETWTQGNRPGS